MALSTTRLGRLGRLTGWPRRIAALACLLLAAASAVTARHGSPAGASAPPKHDANPLTARLGPGEVAAPVAVTGAAGTGYLHAGDHIDLYASPGVNTACAGSGSTRPIGTALAVLAVSGTSRLADDGGQLGLVVAVGHATAARLATLQACGMFAVLDKGP